MKKLVTILVLCCVFAAFVACGGSGNKAVTTFMDKVKAGDVDGAVALIKNSFDRQVPVKVKNFFAGKTVQGYALIEDKDSKAGAAGGMGMAMTQVRITFADGEKIVRFLLKDDGGWVISNILLPE